MLVRSNTFTRIFPAYLCAKQGNFPIYLFSYQCILVIHNNDPASLVNLDAQDIFVSQQEANDIKLYFVEWVALA